MSAPAESPNMPLQDAFQDKEDRRKETPVHSNTPSKAEVSSLMERAAQSSPVPQYLRWKQPSSPQMFLLAVSYVDGINGEPTWEMGPGDEESTEVFFTVTTENPGEVHRLMLKKMTPSVESRKNKQVSDNGNNGTAVRDAHGYRMLGDNELFAGHYRVISQIGHGGMGRIYQAVDILNNRIVALKVLHPHLVEDEHARKRFEHEAKATIHLRHPNLVTLFDYGFSEEGLPFIAMEYLNGEVLQKLLAVDGPLEIRRFLTIFLQACSALHHAHTNRVIHRDVKPANIMLIPVDKSSDLVKLVDFGIAKIVRPEGPKSQRLTQTGDVFGSPFYMSPEQCMGTEMDARSDIYSLGCVMYESISGRRPFEGSNALATMQLQVGTRPRKFNDVAPKLGIPPQIESVILRCLEKEPQDRYQSAKTLGQELERLLTVDQINLDNEWLTNQTQSGTFYTVNPSSGTQERMDLQHVLNLLKESELINGNEYRHAMQLLDGQRAAVSRYLVASGILSEQTMHAAVQAQKLLDRKECKVEMAVIALHYCHRSSCTLREAFDQLGWRMSPNAES